MIHQDRYPPYFLCLCSAEHQPQLRSQCAGAPHVVEFVETIDELLKKGLQHPPLGLVLEISTAVRLGAERMSRFLNLGVNWPIMRCAMGPEGAARVMCFEPPHGEPLVTALDAIAAGEPSWQHPRFKRRHLRLNLPGRVRVRQLGEERWRYGNLQGVSCGGCFVAMTSDAPPICSVVDVELVDFDPKSLQVRGSVVWGRTWEESIELPGIGIEFDQATVHDNFRAYITRCPDLSDLIAD